MHGASGTCESGTGCNLKRFLKEYHSIFKKLPARRSDYLAVKSLQSNYEGKDIFISSQDLQSLMPIKN